MQLVGATAIEDKLQDGVPDTIANLAQVFVVFDVFKLIQVLMKTQPNVLNSWS